MTSKIERNDTYKLWFHKAKKTFDKREKTIFTKKPLKRPKILIDVKRDIFNKVD